MALLRLDAHRPAPVAVERLLRSNAIPSGIGYGPADIQAAYHLDPSKGSGSTVYIIDAYSYKAAASDLAKYRKGAGLPACTTGNGCFKILNEKGQTEAVAADERRRLGRRARARSRRRFGRVPEMQNRSPSKPTRTVR